MVLHPIRALSIRFDPQEMMYVRCPHPWPDHLLPHLPPAHLPPAHLPPAHVPPAHLLVGHLRQTTAVWNLRVPVRVFSEKADVC